jgi:hypothetical protein
LWRAGAAGATPTRKGIDPGELQAEIFGIDHAHRSLFDPEVLSAARPQRVEQKRGMRR